MRRGPFARARQARADERELGTGLWRRDHDRFVRALDRCWQVLQEAEARSELAADELNGVVHATNVLSEALPEVRALPRLNRVILRVTLHSIMHPIFVQDWDAMDRALDALPGLDTVIVSFTFDSLTEPSFFQLYMPRMQAKGRLVFCIDEVRSVR